MFFWGGVGLLGSEAVDSVEHAGLWLRAVVVVGSFHPLCALHLSCVFFRLFSL